MTQEATPHTHDAGACITVTYGSPQNFTAAELSGMSLTEAMDHLREVMNLPTEVGNLLVGGQRVDSTYVLRPGDHFEIVRAAGKKG